MRYRLINSTIEAEQFTANDEQMKRFNASILYTPSRRYLLPAISAGFIAKIGDWIVTHKKASPEAVPDELFKCLYREDPERDVRTEAFDGGRLG